MVARDYNYPPGADHIPRGDGEKFRKGWDRVFGGGHDGRRNPHVLETIKPLTHDYSCGQCGARTDRDGRGDHHPGCPHR